MDSATKELYLQKIEEKVYDEDKIVTCNSLAADLNISIQNSKQLLQDFVKDKRSLKKNDLAVTFIISGVIKETNYPAIYLVEESDLQQKKDLFSKVNSEVTYSVQKNKKIDFNVIALVDKLETNSREKALIGSVVSKNCTKRNIKARKPLPVQSKPVVKEKPSFFTKLPPKNSNNTKEETFEKSTNTIKESPKSNNAKSKAKGLANFFNKAPVKSVKETAPSESKDDQKEKTNDGIKEKAKSDTCNGKKHEEMVIDLDSDQENIKKDDNKPKLKKDGRTTKRSRKDKNNELPSKKRKRIIQRDDSDSDDMFEKEKDDEDDIIDSSLCEEPRVSSPPPVQNAVPKNKRRKAVDKTYEDEEGFIVTKTEYILESASEEETEVPPKPDIPKAVNKSNGNNKETKPKNNSNSPVNEVSPTKPAKGNKKGGKKAPPVNQPSIMNFFKKK